jgi:hypothetical protein
MATDLGVLIIHGIGSQDPHFSDEMILELQDRVDGSDRIAWQPVFWADVLKKAQESYLRRANSKNTLDYMGIRRFVVGALGDASAYRRVNNELNSTYGRIHTIIRDDVANLQGQLGNAKPLVILAHSLGGQIMSNYIWDIQHGTEIVTPGNNSFEKIRTLKGLITFGCNIPLFTFALDKVVPIELPAGAKWVNYYDPDDVLGYLLKPLSIEYRATVSRDISINVGGLFSGWNPLSHNGYWTDNDFTKPVAKFLSGLLQGV